MCGCSTQNVDEAFRGLAAEFLECDTLCSRLIHVAEVRNRASAPDHRIDCLWNCDGGHYKSYGFQYYGIPRRQKFLEIILWFASYDHVTYGILRCLLLRIYVVRSADHDNWH